MITKLANDLNEEISTPNQKDHARAGAGLGAATQAATTLVNAKKGNLGKRLVGNSLVGAAVGAMASPLYRLSHKAGRIVGGENITEDMNAEEINAERQRAARKGAMSIRGTVGGVSGAISGMVAPAVGGKLNQVARGSRLISVPLGATLGAAGGALSGLGSSTLYNKIAYD